MATHTPNKITIHCSDTPNGVYFGSDVIDKIHKARGFKKIGYHVVIEPDGSVEHGRGLNEIGAHVEGHNTGNIGICLIGRSRYTRAQFKSLHYYIHGLMQTYDEIKPWNIYVHNEFDTAIKQGKTCPGFRSAILTYWYTANDERAISEYLLDK